VLYATRSRRVGGWEGVEISAREGQRQELKKKRGGVISRCTRGQGRCARLDLPAGRGVGEFSGVERHAIRSRQAAPHSGSTPMKPVPQGSFRRRKNEPGKFTGSPTATGGVCRSVRADQTGDRHQRVEARPVTLDQRHLDARPSRAMLDEAKAASARLPKRATLRVAWERLWQIDPRRLIRADRDVRRGAIGELRRVAPHAVGWPCTTAAEEVCGAGVT